MNPLLQEAGAASRQLYDADVRELIESSLAWLERMPTLAERHGARMANGMPLAACIGLDEADLSSRHQAAYSLCEQGEFLLALPLALHCCSARADDAGYAFIAGSCLQRLAITDYAALMFRQVLNIDERHMPAAYRLGECLLALGDRDAAIHLFGWAVELGRQDPGLRELQSMAIARLGRLNSAC